MKVYYSVNEFKGVKSPVVTTGTFDGVHSGHRTIIDRLKEIALEKDGETVMLTFSPHPRMVLFPNDHGLKLLNDRSEQIEQLEAAGVEHLIIHPFTTDFSNLSALDYVRTLIIDGIKANTLVVGYDHRFGKNREGDFALLEEYAEMFGFKVEEIPAHMIAATNVSSTKIRKALESGAIEKANRYLGYNYPLSGVVIEGDGIGRTLGYPTANLHVTNPLKLIPANGVYAAKATVSGTVFAAMVNIGTRPTVTESGELRIEAHLIDCNVSLYHREMKIDFIARLRGETKFENRDALIRQLREDRQAVLERIE